MGPTREGQLEDLVQLPAGRRRWWGSQDQGAPAHGLHRPGVAALDMVLGSQGGLHQEPGVFQQALVRRDLDHRLAFGDLLGATHPGRSRDPRQIGLRAGLLGLEQGSGHRDQGDLAHPPDQQVRLGVQQDRPAQRVAPEVVVGDPAQRGLDASQHHHQPREGLADQVRIHDDGPIGAGPGAAARGVGVVVTLLAEGRVVGQHRVQGSCGHAREEPGPSHAQDILRRRPAGLGHDAGPQPPGHQQPPQQGRSEAGMVDVGVARDEQDVQGLPPQGPHLLAVGGQEGGLLELHALDSRASGPWSE